MTLYQCGQGDYREKWRVARDQQLVFVVRLKEDFLAFKSLYRSFEWHALDFEKRTLHHVFVTKALSLTLTQNLLLTAGRRLAA